MTGVVKIRLSLVIKFALTKPSDTEMLAVTRALAVFLGFA